MKMDFQELLSSVLKNAGARTVYGDPVSAEGKTVVPVARVRFGFGGGSGKQTGQEPGEGGGGGGGIMARPVGLIEITSNETRFVPIVDPQSMAFALGFGIVFGWLVGRAFFRK